MKLNNNYDLQYSNRYYELSSISVAEFTGEEYKRTKKTFSDLFSLQNYIHSHNINISGEELSLVAGKVYQEYDSTWNEKYLKGKERNRLKKEK